MAGKKRRRVLILGVGNILLKDEGLGIRAVEQIRERYILPPGVSAVDGGTGGLKLLSLINDYSNVIIIDAVASRSEPGTIHRIPARELPKAQPLLRTAHDIGVMDLLALAGLEGHSPEVVVIGMEPADLSPGLKLSPVIEGRLPEIAALVVKELEGLGVELRERKKSRA